MISVVGEEFLAYSETIKGQFSPLVAVRQYDGSTSYRDLTREDLLRVADDQASPGGWLFKKTQNAASSWIKRYALLRGDYLFFFHSPQNDKPIGVVVVAGSKVVTPDNGGSSFEELTRSYRANEGYEFDITHPSRPTVRLQALSEQERHQWVVAVAARAEKSKASGSTSSRTEYIGNTNIIVTGTRLTGISLTTTKMVGSSADADDYRSYSNAYSPSRSASPSRAAGGVASTNTYGGDNKATSAVPFSGGASTSVGIPRSYSAEQAATIQPSDIAVRAPMQLDVPLQATPPTAGRGRRASVIQTKIMEHSKDMLALEKNLQRKMNEQLEARNREIAVRDRMASRESVQRERTAEEKNPVTLAEVFRLSLFFYNEELVEDPHYHSVPSEAEVRIPHLKGDAVENILVAVYKRYCRGGSNITTRYDHYCILNRIDPPLYSESGYMSLEGFVEFMEDSAILQTHAPHDENDEPTDEYKILLDPIRLLTLVPRNYGSYIGSSSVSSSRGGVTDAYSALNDALIAAAQRDKFTVNFGQFYQLLLRIAQIVYPFVYEADMSLATNKLLQESLCPLSIWSKGRHKRGSTDVLVLEERIQLLLATYAPNLWRVFLCYAQDAVGKHAEVNLSFPENAQSNEKGMFKLPTSLIPSRHLEKTGAIPDSLLIHEASCLKFAADYGLANALMTAKQLKEVFHKSARSKVVVSSRLPTRDMISNKPLSAAQADKLKRKHGAAKPMHFGGNVKQRDRGKSVDTAIGSQFEMADDSGEETVPPPPPIEEESGKADRKHGDDSSVAVEEKALTKAAIVGLGFSEFVEFIARVAVEGMDSQENYNILFPTPFAKVLAVLTVWGVADLEKLEDVRLVYTEELY